jgi:hypothetical protein
MNKDGSMNEATMVRFLDEYLEQVDYACAAERD